MRDIISKYADPIDDNYMAVESFLAENPQPSQWCEDFPGEEVLANKGLLAYEGKSNLIGVLYSYDANKVIIHHYDADFSPLRDRASRR